MRKSLLLLTFCSLTPLAVAQDNIAIERADVPPVALKTAQFYAPDVTFTRIGYEDETGERIYEFEGTASDGRHIEVDVLASGQLEEIEMEQYLDEVPVEVRIELSISYPDFKAKFIEMSARPDGTIVYEFEGLESGQPADVEILDDGRAIRSMSAS